MAVQIQIRRGMGPNGLPLIQFSPKASWVLSWTQRNLKLETDQYNG